jgi:hypothetical protein
VESALGHTLLESRQSRERCHTSLWRCRDGRFSSLCNLEENHNVAQVLTPSIVVQQAPAETAKAKGGNVMRRSRSGLEGETLYDDFTTAT